MTIPDAKEILKLIQQALDFDPLDTAEKVAENKERAQELSFLFTIGAGQLKAKLLQMIDDTYWHIPFDKAVRIIESLGFKSEYEERFREESEIFRVYIHKSLPIVLKIESYHGFEEVVPNSINVFCLIDYSDKDKVNEIDEKVMEAHSSREAICLNDRETGKEVWRDGVAINIDGREALKYKLSKILPHVYVNPWPRKPFLWLLNYEEAKKEDRDYESKTIEKLKQCESYKRIVGWEDDPR